MYPYDTQAWRNALQRAGVESFRWHDLRRTWASWHVPSGTCLHELMQLVGWSKIGMVMVYAHLSAEVVGNSASNIDQYWRRAGRSTNYQYP